MYGRTRRFGGGRRKPPITESTQPCPYKRQRCSGCNGFILQGEPTVRLRLSKRYARSCVSCGVEPKRSKWFHDPGCRPADVNKAMGYDPNVNPPPHVHQPASPVAPPPRPKTANDLALDSLVVLEAAVVAKARERGVTPEMEKAFKTFNALKARILRPGTPAEGEVATTIALKRIIDMVFGS